MANIIKELEVHATIEEETYYPAVEAKAKKDGKDLVAEAEEHHVVKILLGEPELDVVRGRGLRRQGHRPDGERPSPR